MIGKIVDHMHWANTRMLGWMEEDGNLSEPGMRLASHILNVERVWITRAKGSQGDRDTFKVRTLAELADLNRSNHEDFKALLLGDLKAAVAYRLFEGTPGKSSPEDMIIHAFSHGFHHAGQLAAMASASGLRFPDVSFLGYTRAKAAP